MATRPCRTCQLNALHSLMPLLCCCAAKLSLACTFSSFCAAPAQPAPSPFLLPWNQPKFTSLRLGKN